MIFHKYSQTLSLSSFLRRWYSAVLSLILDNIKQLNLPTYLDLIAVPCPVPAVQVTQFYLGADDCSIGIGIRSAIVEVRQYSCPVSTAFEIQSSSTYFSSDAPKCIIPAENQVAGEQQRRASRP